jgi:predicted TIM-barrel fold metal-dependent hydrolase
MSVDTSGPPTSPARSGQRYTVISADTHAVVPKEVFRPYVEARHREAFEEEVRYAADERTALLAGYQAVLGHRPEPTPEARYLQWNRAAEDAEADRVWEPARWLSANEAEGVVATVVYPAGSTSRPPWEVLIRRDLDADLVCAGRRIYNRWLADFCGEAPDRLAGVAMLPPLDDIDRVVAEVEWSAAAGLRGGVWMTPNLSDERPGYHDPRYDPVWAACQANDLPVNFHVEFGGGPPASSRLYGDGPVAWAIAFHDAPPPYRALWFLILGGVLERFPRLRVGFTEQLASWVPYELRRLDDIFHDRSFTAVNRLASIRDRLSLTPIEYWRRNCFVGASFMSRPEAEARYDIGVENVLWGSDFPHPEGTSPVTREALRHTFAGLPEDELRLMLGGNAARVYGFDLQRLSRLAASVGPTVADIAEPLPTPPDVYADKHVFGRGRF